MGLRSVAIAREHLVEAAAAILVLGVLLGFGWALRPISIRSITESDEASAECISGSCWLRSVGSLETRPLPQGRQVPVAIGDEAITLGEGSSLVILIPGHRAELRLKDTAVARVDFGQEKVAASAPESGDEGKSKGGSMGGQSRPVSSSLIYVGEVQIDVHSPKPDAPIVAQIFPSSIHFAFVVESKSDQGLNAWSLGVFEGETLKPLTRFETKSQPAENGTKSEHYADFVVPAAGRYALVPATAEFGPKSAAVSFEVAGDKALEKGIGDALEGLKTGTDTQIEIRGK